jgi:hypothetical protein
MESVAYQRSLLAPTVPTRTTFTTVATLESASRADFAVCNFSDENKTLDKLPTDWPDGSILTIELADADYTVTFLDHESSSGDSSSNIDFPAGVGIPTLDSTEQYAQFRFDADATANQGLWRYIGSNVPHLYDSGWVTSWGDNGLGPNDSGGIAMTEQVDRGFPFKNIQVLFRPNSSSDFVYPLSTQAIMENAATNSTGIGVFYDTNTDTLYIDTMDYAIYDESSGGGGTTNQAWIDGTSEIRVIID